VYELPLGLSDDEGDLRSRRRHSERAKLKAVVPGGSSCPILTAAECDIPMDYDTLAKVGSMLGSGGMVVMDETTDMVRVALRIMRFYAHESCGWCIPCREGTTWLRKILHAHGGRQRPARRRRAAG
jgi:NADH-quinone oxidoreductase subunit F